MWPVVGEGENTAGDQGNRPPPVASPPDSIPATVGVYIPDLAPVPPLPPPLPSTPLLFIPLPINQLSLETASEARTVGEISGAAQVHRVPLDFHCDESLALQATYCRDRAG